MSSCCSSSSPRKFACSKICSSGRSSSLVLAFAHHWRTILGAEVRKADKATWTGFFFLGEDLETGQPKSIRGRQSARRHFCRASCRTALPRAAQSRCCAACLSSEMNNVEVGFSFCFPHGPTWTWTWTCQTTCFQCISTCLSGGYCEADSDSPGFAAI